MNELSVSTINLEKGEVFSLIVGYPKTRLMSLTVPDVGYIMCGILNPRMLDKMHPERKIIAAQFTGICKIDDLLTAKALEVTREAARLGILPGMTGRDILNIMLAIKKEREEAAKA